MPQISTFFSKTRWTTLLCTSILTLTSCNSDEDTEGAPDSPQIIGSWSGTQVYENPVSGTKSKHLEVTFSTDITGELTYEGVSTYSYGKFTYSISGNTISCNGVWASSNEDVDTDFGMSLRIEGDRLIPIDRYQGFILTRDGSVVTNGNGAEIVDNSDILPGVWVKSDHSVVLEFSASNSYTMYSIDSANPDRYSSTESGDYLYDPLRSLLIIGNVKYEIRNISLTELCIYNTHTYRLELYKRGTSNDIPNQADVKEYICNGFRWSTSDNKQTFIFMSNGYASYMEQSNVSVGSFGKTSLIATGTYYVSGQTITCHYSEVSWEGGQYSQYANIFPGWKYDTPTTKTYTVKQASNGVLWLLCSDGDNIKLYSY